MSKAAVVIPIYKEELDDLEKISLARVRKVLKNYPIIFVAPEGKNFSYLEPGEMLVQFHPQFFQNLHTYSQLLLQHFFYEPFLSFDYVLFYQLDAFVFYDALEEFCRLGYDYIGAAWAVSWVKVASGKSLRIGNGGFSLRKVKTCYELLKDASHSPNWNNTLEEIPEDVFFAHCCANKDIDFQAAPLEVADAFSMELYPDRCLKRLKHGLPFDCHGWTKYSADFYVELFAQLGYDLRPLRAQMRTNDYEIYLPQSLEMLALERLIRSLDDKKSLLQYLPIKNFSTVRVIKSSVAMKILARLLTEENFFTDKIFIYDEKNLQELIREATRENLPQLILDAKYDKPLIEAIENKNVISFRQEYLNFQEKFFHSLGKGVFDNGN